MRRNLLVFGLALPIVLGGCVAHMYPKEPMPTEMVVTGTASRSQPAFELAEDISLPNRHRQNQTVLYRGAYAKAIASAGGDFYTHTTGVIGLKPPFGGTEDFPGGLYVPNDRSKECLIFWYTPSAERLGIQGWLTQAVVDSANKAGQIEFYTWVDPAETRIPPCQSRGG